MPHFVVKPARLQGEIFIPPSKSHTLRALLFGALAEGASRIYSPLLSTDGSAMAEACRQLGAQVDSSESFFLIRGINGRVGYAEDVIQAGNSGLVLRMLAAVAALSSYPIVITGDYSIRHQRPMQPLLNGLQQLGVEALSTKKDGFAPIIVQGPLKPGKVVISGEDSQPVSALLIASIFATGPVEIEVKNPGERPWIDLTLNWLKRLKVPYEMANYSYYRMPGNCSYKGFDYHVPGDWSSAAFPLVAALITNSELTLHNVDIDDCQGDRALVNIVEQMGAHLQLDQAGKKLRILKGAVLQGIEVDINHFIDALPILAVLGCYAEGEMRIKNGSVAKQKECDRIACIVKELSKMGAHIKETEDGLIVKRSQLKGALLYSHHDHRIAMSLAVAAMGAKGESVIENTECVAKTFPTFAEEFKKLGAFLS